MATFELVLSTYFELRGRLASGQLSTAAFVAAVDQLLVRDDAGRYWRVFPDDGRWQVHDGRAWLFADPGAAVGRLARVPFRSLLALGAAFVLLGGLLWWEPPLAPSANRPASTAPLVSSQPLEPAPDAWPDPNESIVVVARALEALRGRAPGAADVETLTPYLSWESRIRFPWISQFLRWPEAQQLRLVEYEPPTLTQVDTGGVIAQSAVEYQAPDGGRIRARWAFTLGPEDGRWFIRTIRLAAVEQGGRQS